VPVRRFDLDQRFTTLPLGSARADGRDVWLENAAQNSFVEAEPTAAGYGGEGSGGQGPALSSKAIMSTDWGMAPAVAPRDVVCFDLDQN